MNITEDRCEQALRYLASTDEPLANLKSDVARAEYKAKAIKNAGFLRIEGGSIADRQAKAEDLPDYKEAMEHYFALLSQFEFMRNKRSTEQLVWETWRSLSANRRAG